MSKRKEKYARTVERRVEALEERVDKIGFDLTAQGVRVSTTADLVEAMALPTYLVDIKQDVNMRKRHRAENAERRKRETNRRRLLLATILAVITLAWLFIATHGAAANETAPKKQQAATGAVVAIKLDAISAAPDLWGSEGEDPLEAEKIEAALLDQGYFSDAVPLTYDLQDYMRTACEEYGCPYPLALAVAEVESQFDMDAVGAVGEVGIMQLNPGTGGSYHAELEAATGQDPTTPPGNIAGGCYLLGKYMTTYGDQAKAAMAYNMGESAAKKAWAAGATSTDYTTAVLAAMERWECTVNNWN